MARFHPESKVLTIIIFILAVVLAESFSVLRLGFYLLFLFTFLTMTGVSLWKVILRSLFFLPFLGMIIIFGVLPTGDVTKGVLLFGKGWLSALALSALSLSADFSDLLKGLRRLGLPQVLVMLLAFMYRYLHLLQLEAKRMEIAWSQRYFGGNLLGQFKVVGNIIGNLFLRTYERGERVHQAMVLRGFAGQWQSGEGVVYSRSDYLLVCSSILVLVLTKAGLL